MSRWFRVYDSVLDDPKVQRLEPGLFKAWINLLCLASRHGGALPPIEDIAFALRLDAGAAAAAVAALQAAGLVDAVEGALRPHKWDERQFTAARTGAERQRRYRERQRDVTGDVRGDVAGHAGETAPESERESESESEAEAEQNQTKQADAGASAGKGSQQHERTHGIDLIAWQPDGADHAYAAAHGLDPARILEDIRGWAANVAPARRRKRDPRAFWQGWCRRAADRIAAAAGGADAGQRGQRPGAPGIAAAMRQVIAARAS